MAPRGRPPSAKTLVDRQLGRNVPNPVLPAGDTYIVPNHSGISSHPELTLQNTYDNSLTEFGEQFLTLADSTNQINMTGNLGIKFKGKDSKSTDTIIDQKGMKIDFGAEDIPYDYFFRIRDGNNNTIFQVLRSSVQITDAPAISSIDWAPVADATYDFGNSNNRWKDGYFSGTVTGGSNSLLLEGAKSKITLTPATDNESLVLRQTTAGSPSTDIMTVTDSGDTEDFFKIDNAGKISKTQQMLAETGTNSLPSYSFSSDANTGIYWASTPALKFTINGFQNLDLDGGGLFLRLSGSASTPALRVGDADTGIFRPSSNELAFSSGGVEFLRLDGITQKEFVINETGVDIDFRVEAIGASSALFINGADGEVSMSQGLALTGALTGGGAGHDQFSDFVANEHIDWTAATSDFQTAGTLTIGVDDTGHDVKFFGATSGNFLLWDESADTVILSSDSKIAFRSEAGATIHSPSAGVLNYTVTGIGAAHKWLVATTEIMGVSTNPGVVLNDAGGSAVDFRVESNNNTHMLFVDSGNNAVGINVALPSEALDIDGRLELTPQSGSTNNGAIWNDSTQKSLQTFVGGIEQSLNGCIFTQTADKTVADTVIETTLFGTGVGTLTLPANFWVVGKTIRLEIHGDMATTGNPTAEVSVHLDAVEMSESGAITLPGLGGTEEWECEVIMTCRSVGVTGTIETVVDFEYETTTGSSPIERMDIAGTLQTVDTTQADTLDVRFEWGTASASNTITSEIAIVQVLN